MLTISSVKAYHENVSSVQYARCDKCKCPKSMFYFYTSDNKGYPLQERKRGLVVHNSEKTSVEFFLTKKDLLKKYGNLVV